MQWPSSVLHTLLMDKEDEEEHKEIRIRDVLVSLPVFDDLYLRMQAMNIDLVDAYLEDMELNLLKEYMEIERTPLESAVTVSAFSQLWVFGLYELLRTWRQRASEVYSFADDLRPLDKSSRKSLIAEKKHKIKEATASGGAEFIYWRPYEKVAKDDAFVESIRKAVDQSERLFRRIEALRMSIAKHEVPKAKGSFAVAPGYGRIDMTNGSIYWQIVLQGNEVDLISRRSLADGCRDLGEDRSHAILPINIQNKVSTFPKHGYGVKTVTVILKDGTEYKKVLVAWSKEVIHVSGQEKIPFDADEVVDVRR
jgi:hypothetical protein